MNRVKYYNVAGHTFRFIFPDSPKLWAALDKAYSPFEIPSAAEESLIFTLEYVEELNYGPLECVYDKPTQPGATVLKMFRSGTDWIIKAAVNSEHPVCATVFTDSSFKCARIKLENKRIRDTMFAINNAAMLLYAFSTVSCDTLEFHASVIENDGKAYLFLGRSGTGKSTHSSLWIKYIEGSELMNDDNPIVRICPDGIVRAYGSPWSGKTPCYRNVCAPVGAFVQIRQHPENIIRRQKIVQGYSSLFSSVSGLKDNYVMTNGINASLDKVLSSVACYVLDCRPDEQAARLCSETVR